MKKRNKKVEQLIIKLINISSVSGYEKAIQEEIIKILDGVGVKARYVQGNVVGVIRGEVKKKAIIFNAHVDTVAAGKLSQWNDNSWKARQVGERVYGLGASDEKPGVASLLLLAEYYAQNKPACDVWFHFVVKEEVDGSGTKEVMEWFENTMTKQYEEVAGILVEPTGLKKIEIAHKGNWFVKLKVKGDGGHGSRPDLNKINVVIQMGKVLEKVDKLNIKWKKKYFDKLLGSPTIGVGTAIAAGNMDCPNKFADSCEASLDVRTVPSMHEKVLVLLKEELKTESVEVSCLYEPAGYGFTEMDNPLVLALQKGNPMFEVGVSAGSTDQCFFTKYQIPAIIFGPGEISCVHQANEFCYPIKIEEFVKIIIEMIPIWVDNQSRIE